MRAFAFIACAATFLIGVSLPAEAFPTALHSVGFLVREATSRDSIDSSIPSKPATLQVSTISSPSDLIAEGGGIATFSSIATPFGGRISGHVETHGGGFAKFSAVLNLEMTFTNLLETQNGRLDFEILVDYLFSTIGTVDDPSFQYVRGAWTNFNLGNLARPLIPITFSIDGHQGFFLPFNGSSFIGTSCSTGSPFIRDGRDCPGLSGAPDTALFFNTILYGSQTSVTVPVRVVLELEARDTSEFLVSEVPEPSTLFLSIIGASSLGALRWARSGRRI